MNRALVESALALVMLTGCRPSDDPYIRVRVMTDNRDSLDYPTMGVPGKLWLAFNVAYKTPNSWCYNDTNRCSGRLYSFEDAKTKACPDGWHLPSEAEWKGLIEVDGGYFDLPSKTAVGDPNTSYTGLTIGSFKAVLGGSRTPEGKYIDQAPLDGDGDGIYWTSSPCGGADSVSLIVFNSHSKRILRDCDGAKGWAFSVRCAKGMN